MDSQVTAVVGDEAQLYFGLGDGTIQTWRKASRSKIDEFVGHDGSVRSILLLKDTLVSVGARGSAAKWRNGALISRLRLKDSHLNTVCVADQETLILGGDRGQISRAAEPNDWIVKGIHGRGVFDLAYAAEEGLVYSVGTDGTIGRRAWETGAAADSFAIANHWLHTVDYLDGHLWVGSEKGHIYVVNAKTGQTTAKLTHAKTRLITSSHSDDHIAFGTTDGWVYILNYKTKRLLRSIKAQSSPVLGLWLNGKELVVSGNGTTVRFYPDYDKEDAHVIEAGGT